MPPFFLSANAIRKPDLSTPAGQGEIRQLRRQQINFDARTIRVGKAKTDAGTNRVIPMNDRLTLALRTWARKFSKREPSHYVFPVEQYGQPGEKKPGTYDSTPRGCGDAGSRCQKNYR